MLVNKKISWGNVYSRQRLLNQYEYIYWNVKHYANLLSNLHFVEYKKRPKREQISRDICTPEDRLDRFSRNAQATNWIEVTKKNVAYWSISMDYWLSLFGQDGWILASFFFCLFMDRDEVELAKHSHVTGPAFYDTAHGPEFSSAVAIKAAR